MRLLLASDGRVETGALQDELRCSAPTARAILETLDKLGIGHLSNPGPPEPGALTLDSSLEWLVNAHGVKNFSMADPLKENRRPCGRGH
jgi:hypothetical protein